MGDRSAARAALLLSAAVMAPLLLPIGPEAVAPAASAPPASAPPASPTLAGFGPLREFLLRHAPAPPGALERALDRLPFPFGSSDSARLLAGFDASPPGPTGGPALALSGDIDLAADWFVGGDLTLTNATVRFLASGVDLRVAGALTIADSTLQTAGLGPNARGTVEALGALDVQRSTFRGVTLVARNTSAAALVAASTFRDTAGAGVVADRPNLEVRGSTFVNLSAGVDVTDAHGFPQLGPLVHNNTFEMNRAGISVGGDSAGRYHHNVGRANFLAVSCTTPGATDAQGNAHRPRFSENNLFTNYLEAISGLRGITIPTPIGNIEVPNSACDHDRPYLGPSGAARDTTFTSSDDTLTNIRTSPNPTSAPALPLPLTEITDSQTWTGTRDLAGPVVVNSPGALTLSGATVRGPYYLGPKAAGRIESTGGTLDPLMSLVLRNSADDVAGLTVGGPQHASPVTMYRCNCTLGSSRVTSPGLAVTVLAGLLTDDTQWRPTIEGNTLDGGGVGITVAIVRPQVTDNTFLDPAIGILSLLATTNFQDNVVERAQLAVTSILDTFSSTGNRYESGLVGVVAALATTTFASDVVASYQIGMLPVLPTTFSVTSSNVTFNGVGIIPVLGVATIATTNLVDNYFLSLATLPIDTGDLDIPTGITCSSCWGPADEARWGNITYVGALGANDVPEPPWHGLQTVALSGQTKDLAGTLAAPAVARSGGTLRVRETTLDLAGMYPVGAKGGGQGGGTTGKLVVENATVRHGAFLALNSTSSTITHSRFEDFPDAALTLVWNGATITCSAFRGVGAAARFNIQKGDPAVFRRVLVEGATGLTTGFIGQVKLTQDGRVEDSGFRAPGGGLFHRAALGDAQLHRSNLLGPPGAVGAGDSAGNVTGFTLGAFNATDAWWGDPEGPDQAGTRFSRGDVAPLLAPHAGAAFAPALCPAWDVVTAAPREDAPVAFRDRTIDPSALGLADRAWDFGDGLPVAHAGGEAVSHAFPDGGAYAVTLLDTSHSGANATLARSVTVAHVPPRPAFGAAVVDEVTAVAFTDQSTHPNPNDAPPTGWAYRWTFGDAQGSTQREPSHRYADGGTYAVRLNTTDDDGLAAEAAHSVQVPHVAPVAAFTAEGSLETDTFTLTDASTHPNAPTDGIANRTWSCTDGFTAFAATVQHKFADGGAPRCTLTVRDDDGMSSSVTRTLAVQHVAPAAAFAPPGGAETATLAFTDQSTHSNPPDAPPAGWAYAWVFGDGATSTERSPGHRYADGGTYTATLQATDNDGLGSTASRSLEVAHVAPAADFTFAPAAPVPGGEVAFTSLGSHPNAPHDAIVAWHWDFADGATSVLPDPGHVFEAQGNYDVTLTLTDDDGLQASITRRVAVGNFPPVAAWSSSPAEPTDLDTIQFTDESTDADGAVLAWAWDFGDGATSTAQHPAHLYAEDGTYEARLTVTDDRGASGTLARAIVVRNVAPSASFAFGPDDPLAGQEVTFADGSLDPDGAVVAWAWDFGDGATSAAQDPTHAWAEGGDYVVTLTVTDDDGATASATREVHVCETGLDLATLTFELCLRLPL